MATTSISEGTVLICDDDADIRDALAVNFETAHYKVHTVSGYEELRHQLIDIDPDVILLDICMPDYDGFYVADSLQLLGEKAPIIFITAFDNPKNRLTASFVSRVHAYVRKPFDPDELLATVRHAIKTSQKKRDSGREFQL
jgi:DNA-binding response OmpR family regulator